MSSFVGFLNVNASTSCVNTRTTNLIDVIRDVKINIYGNIDDSISDNELKFLRDYYNVKSYRYVLIPNELLDTYLDEIQELSGKEQTYSRTIKHTNKETGEVTEENKIYTKPLIEIKLVPDTTNNHQVYIIKNSTINEMIVTFKDTSKGGIADLNIYDKNNKPRLIKKKTPEKKEKPEKEHKEGTKVSKVKLEDKKTPAKGKASSTKGKTTTNKATPTKNKKPVKIEEPDPEEVGEEEVEEVEEEIEDEEVDDE